MTSAVQFLIDQPQKVDPFINGVKYPVSYWTEKGGRPYQEDRHEELKGSGASDSSLYGVFDGHGGHRAAQYCKDYLLKCIAGDAEFEANPAKALFRSFFKVDAEFSAKARIQMMTDGSTATVAIIHDGKVYVGNAGDSRAIIVKKGGKIKPMSDDHRPDRKDEEQRIRKLGGSVVHWGRWRVEGILAVSRSIGDVTLQPYITCEPEIIEKQIEPDDEYLVLASDGVFDVIENEDVGKIVLRNARDFLNVAKRLCTEAIIMGTQDNVTALVIDLKQRVRLPTKEGGSR
eukprot:CAMPEP_0170449776 /NCGR_PEP_ID=MMETSP0117_2-20130122/51426_1 /TAXON_ID=400756 /ORGANISM="Durinskia baltica, Strain CSIRO CS-38" /LENGTH=286 /DNA_ID=CAMNT_0010711043 /DNA_START=251 /DNA_END=1111 /DNA_ORIENTATION=+